MDESVYSRIGLWPNRLESEQLCRSNHLMTDVFDSWPWSANSLLVVLCFGPEVNNLSPTSTPRSFEERLYLKPLTPEYLNTYQ